jgi:2,3,4,5-tetrahydropyridine-2-carboxylate N-succinyltransferase
MNELSKIIEQAFERRNEITPENVSPEIKAAVDKAIELLDKGQARVAEPAGR